MAETFWSRLRGLIGKAQLEPGEGLLIPRCNDIHMWFMSVPLDVVFLRRGENARGEDGEKSWRISTVRANVPAWKLLPLHDWKAHATLELPVGTIQRCDLRAGDELCLS
ncbi:DUF192 domain-containing protein [Bdellovibrionota bacterium FG-2]